jgi:hypothetical protein
MKFPQDSMWQESIRRAPTPALAKKMGLNREHPLRGDWDQIKERVMKAALLAKFRQNPGLLALLQSTGDKPLVEASPGDAYWGAGPRGKGQNRTGALLAEVRAELKDVRVDAGLLAAAPEVGVEGEDADGGTEPEDIVAGANAAVAAATGGVVQVVGAGAGGAGNGVQGGGVYMFINTAAAGGVESKARRARGSRRSQRISWEGMSVEREGSEGSEGSDAIQEGGGAGVAGEAMTTDMGSSVEVKVEKLG